MMSTAIPTPQMDAEDRASLAIDALGAVRDLCIEASQTHGATLSHVDPNDLAALLGLILNELHPWQNAMANGG